MSAQHLVCPIRLALHSVCCREVACSIHASEAVSQSQSHEEREEKGRADGCGRRRQGQRAGTWWAWWAQRACPASGRCGRRPTRPTSSGRSRSTSPSPTLRAAAPLCSYLLSPLVRAHTVRTHNLLMRHALLDVTIHLRGEQR